MLFFFNDTATTEIYTLSLHDALPILRPDAVVRGQYEGYHDAGGVAPGSETETFVALRAHVDRSEEHTSELQSRQYLVCRLLLEKKKKHYFSHLFDTSFLLSSLLQLPP